MRTAILFSLLALTAAAPAFAQETDDDRYRRLEAFVFGEANRLNNQRLQQLTSADRLFMTRYAASISSDFVRCQNGGADAAEACARSSARRRVPAAYQPAVAAVPPVSRPFPRDLTAEQQQAAATLHDLTARLGHLPIEAFLKQKTSDPIPYEQECRQADAAVRLLGPPYRSPCPTGEQKQAVYAQWGRNSAALERQRAAEIAETQRIESVRAAAARAAVANSGSGLVEVRTYDRNGNYTGTRMMTPSQAATVGARPQ